jgi:predicted nucleotidyltransferase
MISSHIQFNEKQIEEFCKKRKIAEFAFFGSVIRSDFRPDSDVDVLVTFAADAHWSLWDLVDMQDELKTMFGRKVDLVQKAGIRNPFRKKHILENMNIIYVA